jgi:hypothetical protein
MDGDDDLHIRRLCTNAAGASPIAAERQGIAELAIS